jgi:adenylylsulfate kinase-like enzyme
MQRRNLSPVTSEGEGVLITGVYGAGKSSVAVEIAYLLEQQQRPFALLDLDYFGWGGADFSSDDASHFLMLRNVAAVAANYREAGVGTFVVAWFVRDRDALRSVQEAVGVPLRVVRLTVPLEGIRQRLASDPSAERAVNAREAEAQLAGSEGVGVEDLVVANDRPIAAVTGEIMSWLGWE